MLYVFILDDKVMVSSINPEEADSDTLESNSFEATFSGLAADFAIAPICNMLRAGGGEVICLN